MTIAELLTGVDKTKPSSHIPREEKVRWLNRLDMEIKKTVIDTHEGGESITFTPYDETTDENTSLLVAEPFSEMYEYYMRMKIDLFNEDMSKYADSAALFNAAYDNFKKFYNRTVMPIAASEFKV